MIKWFHNVEQANAWMVTHPEWEITALSTGSITGSVLVGFKLIDLPIVSGEFKPVPIAVPVAVPKRRGRPPKEKISA